MTIRLTPRQYEVARELACDGANNKEIAERLGISAETVRTHMAAIRDVTGIRDRTALAVALIRSRVVVLPPVNERDNYYA